MKRDVQANDLDRYVEYVRDMLEVRRDGRENPNDRLWGPKANTLAEKYHLPVPYDESEWSGTWPLVRMLGQDDPAETRFQACIDAAESRKSESVQRPASKKRRPTASVMSIRNKSVAWFILEFEQKHDRAPDVSEVQRGMSLTFQKIYATTAYKQNKIRRRGKLTASQLTGRSVAPSEYFTEKSEESSRATKRGRVEQDQLDALIDQQQHDDHSDFVR